MVFDTTSSNSDPQVIFRHICDLQVVKKSEHEIDKILVDMTPTILMPKIDCFLSRPRCLLVINQFEVAKWVETFIQKLRPEMFEYQKFTKEWSDI